QPAVGEVVVEHARVAVVVSLARPPEAAPDRVDWHRAVDRRAALVEDGKVGVDDLEEMVRAGGAVGVGWCGGDGEGAVGSGEALPDAVEVVAERRRGRIGGAARGPA